MATTSTAGTKGKATPFRQFLDLLSSEKRVIGYIYLYAVFSGLVSLSLPLGIQSLIGFVSGGELVTSVTVLIFFIVVGVLVVGALQVMQLSLVEHIQQRIFATKAFEFSSHLTQLKSNQMALQNLPELMNRFFDVISLQKGIAKMLTDFSAAAIQIVFGLILLSFYHPYFIIFGVLLILILVLILRLTAPRGMHTSLEESTYKYRLVNWLEEMARNITIFKVSTHENLSLQKTDAYTSNYLKAREAHFKVLITQYIGFVGFKTVITAALLLMGSLLLVNQEINLGQFVATEIIIILIINAVEKLLVKLDVVYDVLTSLVKLSAVTDLPMQEKQEANLPVVMEQEGVAVEVRNVSFTYGGATREALSQISFTCAPGEKICLAGSEEAGRSTLLQILAGIQTEYAGTVVLNGLSLQDYGAAGMQGQIGFYLLPSLLFEGTVLENMTMGQPEVTLPEVLWALELVELSEYVQALLNGLQTVLYSNALNVPVGVAQRLALARSIVRKPKLLLLDSFIPSVSRVQRERIAKRILQQDLPWTVLLLSNDVGIMQLCHRVLLLQKGQLLQDIQVHQTSKEALQTLV
ncbi:peptidase domain-containing ABC transporter [Rufibacter sp. LB8]|uniref:peptidase domain-containing ABC transporter n=1 Tax=Rufibacter sp. LB8 TaxID=2777781 RepID=UPI00178C80B6|nr:ATP-binding cassette domain-containing protein [Rufibacter sp. LB8]